MITVKGLSLQGKSLESSYIKKTVDSLQNSAPSHQNACKLICILLLTEHLSLAGLYKGVQDSWKCVYPSPS